MILIFIINILIIKMNPNQISITSPVKMADINQQINDITNDLKELLSPIKTSVLNKMKENYNVQYFTDYIYNKLNIKRSENKVISEKSQNFIYLESEQPKDITNYKIFSCSYYYTQSERKIEYMDGFRHTLNRLYRPEFNNPLSEYYIYLYIDFTVLMYMEKDFSLNRFLRDILSYDKVLIQFYYCGYNIIEENKEISHNKGFGTLIRYYPYAFPDDIHECHIGDIDTDFSTYIQYSMIKDFENSNKSFYFWQCEKTNQFETAKVLNRFCAAGINGFRKAPTYTPVISEIFKIGLIKFIQKDTGEIKYDDKYKYYEMGYDEIFMNYCYNMLKVNNCIDAIKLYGDKCDLLYLKYNKFDYGEIFNKVVYIDKKYYLYYLCFMLIIFYNLDHIVNDQKLIQNIADFLSRYNINIQDLVNFYNTLNNSKHSQFIEFRNKYHASTKDEFMNLVYSNYLCFLIPPAKNINIKLLHYYY